MSKVETMSQQPQIPEGMNPDARETWPSPELIESWLGDSVYDLHLGPGDDVAVPGEDPAAAALPLLSSAEGARFEAHADQSALRAGLFAVDGAGLSGVDAGSSSAGPRPSTVSW